MITLGRIHTQEISLQKKLEAQTKTRLLIKFLHFKGESQGFVLTSVADHLVFPFFTVTNTAILRIYFLFTEIQHMLQIMCDSTYFRLCKIIINVNQSCLERNFFFVLWRKAKSSVLLSLLFQGLCFSSCIHKGYLFVFATSVLSLYIPYETFFSKNRKKK